VQVPKLSLYVNSIRHNSFPRFLRLAFFAIPALTTTTCLAAGDAVAVQRKHMVSDQIENRGIRNPDVLRVMRATPRHLFVPADVR